MEQSPQINIPYQQSDYFHRGIAKAIDLLLCSALGKVLFPVGVFAALLYILISDGLKGGGSIGKQIIGLTCVDIKTGTPCTFRQSFLRNAPFGIIFILYLIPMLGLVLAVLAALVVILFEGYFVVSDKQGLRVGDHIAGTIVVEKSFNVRK